MGKKKTGRPLKLTQKVNPTEPMSPTFGDRIVQALDAGSFFDDACDYAGVSKTAGYDWLARGRALREEIAEKPENYEPTGDERALTEFTDAVEKARAAAVITNLAIIRTAAQSGQWQAAAWWLERTRPDKYGRHQREATDETPLSTEAAREKLLGLDLGVPAEGE